MSNNSLIISLVFVVAIFTLSCKHQTKNENKIDGLWLVKKVKAGDKEMTPIARWMQFNSDSTQTSGNGWLQHSFGTWMLNAKNELSVTNTNGIIDTAAPFKIILDKNKMTWSREEEGQNVKVFLEKIDKTPTSEGNKLMGLWELNEVIIEGESEEIESNKTLYIAWDNRYIKQFEPDKKEYGIYKIHGHKPEIQMVNYGDKPAFKYYKFSLKSDDLVLKSADDKEEMKFFRIHQFPQ